MGNTHVIALFFSLLAGCAIETQSMGSGNGLTGTGPDGGVATSPDGGGSEVIVDGLSCTPATEEVDCPETSCDPRTLHCSTYRRGTRAACTTCVSDSDCEDEGHRCVPMFFGPDRFPDSHTGFCLEIAELEGPDGYDCDRPYVTVLHDLESLSGVKPDSYCGVQEAMTTCFAVSAFQMEEACPDGTDAECPRGGLCRSVGNDANAMNICTFECTANDECPRFRGERTDCGEYYCDP
jgi:hypothetical protein